MPTASIELMAMNKKELLFQYAQEAFNLELERFKSAEEKAGRFITLLSITIVAYGAALKVFAEDYLPPKSPLEWILFSIIALTLVALASSWSLLFRSLNMIQMPRMPLTDKTFENFGHLKIENLQHDLARTYKQGLDIARINVEDKFKLLKLAYRDITLSAWLVFASFTTLVVISFFET